MNYCTIPIMTHSGVSLTCGLYTLIIITSHTLCLVEGKTNWDTKIPDNFAAMGENMDRHQIFSNPLTKGVYVFDQDGYLPAEPLKRLRKIHLQMMKAIGTIEDFNTKVKYLMTLSNSANDDIKQLRKKLKEFGIVHPEDLDKTKLKSDAFLLMLSHAGLVSNSVLYFPDIMYNLVHKNPEFESNLKWVIQFSVTANLTQDKIHLKLFDLAQQEIGIIPKKPNYRNPYSAIKMAAQKSTISTTTKKPRKRLERGPRMSRGELR